nr:LysR substrate-binding domain-containing protein [Trabulsiella odontotermitis]
MSDDCPHYQCWLECERQYQTAVAGMGVIQVTEERVRGYLTSGAIHRILDDRAFEFEGYYLCWIAGRKMSPAMRAFIDWMRNI